MRRSAAGLSALLAFALAATGSLAGSDGETPGKSPSQVEKTFLIPASEGYGVGECLALGSGECGKVVADAWCEAQGFALAGSFGVAAPEDHTGAIAATASSVVAPIKITCRD